MGLVVTMSNLTARIERFAVGATAALGCVIAPSMVTDEPASQPEARPCYNGIVPGNPWVTSCNFYPRQPRIRGAAPDQNAIIACRGFPGCLSWYVNGPW
jgi:hypothetical protein